MTTAEVLCYLTATFEGLPRSSNFVVIRVVVIVHEILVTAHVAEVLQIRP